MVCRPCAISFASCGARPQELRPAENGVERRAQLVRERGEEFVLQPARAFALGARGAFAVEQAFALLRAAERNRGLMDDAIELRDFVAAVERRRERRAGGEARRRCR